MFCSLQMEVFMFIEHPLHITVVRSLVPKAEYKPVQSV